jgi:hypothetical protein
MALSEQEKLLGSSGLKGPIQYFAEFCAEERVRRIRAGEAFDSARFEAVVELVMTKLRSLDEDGSES